VLDPAAQEEVVDHRNGIQVLARAAEILRLLADSSGGLSFSQLVARAGLPRTTVHRIRQALEQEGFVAVDPATGRLQLGPGLLRLAVASRKDLRTVAASYLERLSQELNETVDLSVLDGMHVLFIAQFPAPHRELMAVSKVGARFPAYCTANGKVLLADLPEDQLIRRLPRRLEVCSTNVVSRDDLLRELDEIRRTSLGYDRGEHRPGICSVGVAVMDVDGTVAAISVPMPAARFDEAEDDVIAALLRTRDAVSAALRGE
jgi:DNA-binding IclR family transcriptional regulator